MQLDTLAAATASLLSEPSMNPNLRLSDPKVSQALTACDVAISSLVALMDDLLRILERRTTNSEASGAGPRTEQATGLAGEDDPVLRRRSAQTGSNTIPAAVLDASPHSERLSDAESDCISESGSEFGSESGSEPDSESDSDIDSGYASTAGGDRNDGDFYNQFISGCKKEGPTMANRGENTERAIRTTEVKWEE